MLRWRRLIVSGLAIVAAALVFYPRTCSDVEKQSIVVASDRITVVNLSKQAWTDVDVWLNDYYRAQAPELLPGQRLDVPIGVFVAGFGQRLDPKKQSPFGVEVSARGADGKPVRL